MSIYSEVLEIQDKLLACVNMETGEINDDYDIYEELRKEALAGGIGKLCKVDSNIQADIEALKVEERRIAKKRKHLENSQERLKKYIESIMALAGETKVKDGTFTVSIRKSEAVNVLNLDILPAEFKKVAYTADKNAIKEAIKAGKEVAGAEIIENTSINIR